MLQYPRTGNTEFGWELDREELLCDYGTDVTIEDFQQSARASDMKNVYIWIQEVTTRMIILTQVVIALINDCSNN